MSFKNTRCKALDRACACDAGTGVAIHCVRHALLTHAEKALLNLRLPKMVSWLLKLHRGGRDEDFDLALN